MSLHGLSSHTEDLRSSSVRGVGHKNITIFQFLAIQFHLILHGTNEGRGIKDDLAGF
jgi:hypothetical protein